CPSCGTGAVYVYDRAGPGAPWESAGFIPNPAPSYGLFGQSIAISGDRIAIGAPGESFGFADQGVVLLYDYDGGLDNWTETTTLGAGGAGSYQFGWSIDYAPDGTLAIGAPGIDGGVPQNEGQVFVYDGTVTQIDPLVVPTAGVGAELGASVSIDARPGGGHRLAVGAPGNAAGEGLYRVLDDTGGGFVSVDAGTGPAGNRMGQTVVVDGDRVAYNNGTGNANVRSTSDGGATWTTELIASIPRGSYSPASNLQFALEGGTFAVGQPNLNQVQIFRYDGVDWGGALALGGGVDRLLPTGADGDDRAGWSVALDGGSLVAGAPGDDWSGDGFPDAGAVYTADIPVVATFSGTSAGDATAWNDPTNWDVGRVPGPNDTAILPSSVGTVNVVGATPSVSRLITSTGGLVLATGGRLSVIGSPDGPSEIRDGIVRVNLDGGLELVSDLVIDADGILATSYDDLAPVQIDITGTDVEISGNGTIQNDGGIRYSGAGTFTLDDPNMNWSAGPSSLLRADDGTINLSPAAFDWSQGTVSIGAGARVAFDAPVVQGGLGVLEIDVDGAPTDPANFGVIEAAEYGPNGTLRVVLAAPASSGEVYPVIECSSFCNEAEAFDSIDFDPPTVELQPTLIDDAGSVAGIGLVQIDAKLTSPQAIIDAGFGTAIDVFGDTAIVGYDDGPTARAEVLTRDPGTGDWTVEQSLFVGATDINDVAINDQYAVVAAADGVSRYVWDGSSYGTPSFRPVDVPAVDVEGQYLLYVLAGTQAQVVDQTVGSIAEFGDAPGGLTSFGDAVAFVDGYAPGSGQVAIGSPADDTVVVLDAGVGVGGLGNPTTLTGPEGPSNSFGASLAATDGRIAVGEPNNSTTDLDAGAVWVYDASTLTAPDRLEPDSVGDPGYDFGTDVAIVDDRIVAGAPGANPTASQIRDGLAYAFEFDGSDWSQTEQYQAVDLYDGDEFGAAVGLATDHVLIGAPGDANAKGPDAGAVYWYEFAAAPEPPDPADNPTFAKFEFEASSDPTVAVSGTGISTASVSRDIVSGREQNDGSVASTALGSIDVDAPVGTGVESSPIASLTLDETVLAAVDGTSPLDRIPLTDIELRVPITGTSPQEFGGWEYLLERIARARPGDAAAQALVLRPVQNILFGEVKSFDEVAELRLDQLSVAGTPIASLPIASLVLGSTPIASLPIASLEVDGSPVDGWCDAIAAVGSDVACGPGEVVDPVSTTLVELALVGVPIASLPIASLPIASLPIASLAPDGTPIASLPIAS
ncbi:FG-GAP repeat protein, partial [Ilumatobacter nonamiensis]|uniref:FG-GAP repeat protein n=1 Tax=Ilumatobacter nonamiensis TaxID=467093 RepID=UPI0019D3ADC7